LSFLRNPTDLSIGDELGETVIKDFIPAIALLRRSYNFKFKTLFSTSAFVTESSSHLWISDVERSDTFFDSITFK
jgi:hypothetical protein